MNMKKKLPVLPVKLKIHNILKTAEVSSSELALLTKPKLGYRDFFPSMIMFFFPLSNIIKCLLKKDGS